MINYLHFSSNDTNNSENNMFSKFELTEPLQDIQSIHLVNSEVTFQGDNIDDTNDSFYFSEIWNDKKMTPFFVCNIPHGIYTKASELLSSIEKSIHISRCPYNPCLLPRNKYSLSLSKDGIVSIRNGGNPDVEFTIHNEHSDLSYNSIDYMGIHGIKVTFITRPFEILIGSVLIWKKSYFQVWEILNENVYLLKKIYGDVQDDNINISPPFIPLSKFNSIHSLIGFTGKDISTKCRILKCVGISYDPISSAYNLTLKSPHGITLLKKNKKNGKKYSPSWKKGFFLHHYFDEKYEILNNDATIILGNGDNNMVDCKVSKILTEIHLKCIPNQEDRSLLSDLNQIHLQTYGICTAPSPIHMWKNSKIMFLRVWFDGVEYGTIQVCSDKSSIKYIGGGKGIFGRIQLTKSPNIHYGTDNVGSFGQVSFSPHLTRVQTIQFQFVKESGSPCRPNDINWTLFFAIQLNATIKD